MREFEKKRIVNKRLYSNFSILILIIALLGVSTSIIEVWKKYRYTKDVFINTEKKLTDLNQNKKNLEQKIYDLNTDFGKENEIRNRYYLAKPDEGVVIIIDKTNEENIESNEKIKPKGLIEKIKALFW